MLLDEPTNHLDIDAREALMQALNNYKGAVILVSHDPHLVECVAERLWLVADGTCKSYDDDLDAYRKLIVQQRRKERSEARADAGKGKGKNKTPASEQDAEKLERKVADLTLRKNEIENEIALIVTDGDAKQLKRLNKTYEELGLELERAEAAWADCLEQL
jgi:ATP-binding cassette subfamily F protein 3